MSRRTAMRGFNKVADRCPYCGSRRPKELVEGEGDFNWTAYILVGVLTCGLGFLAFPAFKTRSVKAYCDECERTFAVRD